MSCGCRCAGAALISTSTSRSQTLASLAPTSVIVQRYLEPDGLVHNTSTSSLRARNVTDGTGEGHQGSRDQHDAWRHLRAIHVRLQHVSGVAAADRSDETVLWDHLGSTSSVCGRWTDEAEFGRGRTRFTALGASSDVKRAQILKTGRKFGGNLRRAGARRASDTGTQQPCGVTTRASLAC